MQTPNTKRREFTLIFDVVNGNPNGDPDTGNNPRRDDETGIGWVTAECSKRKIRSSAETQHSGEPGFEMFIARNSVLSDQVKGAYEQAGVTIEEKKPKNPKVKAQEKDSRVEKSLADKGNKVICERFFDVRWFGALITGFGTGRITGPIQIQAANSVLPIDIVSVAGTRSAVANKTTSENQKGLNQNFVRRGVIPHAVYVQHGHLNAFQAMNTGFMEKDWTDFLSAVRFMFELDRSSTRGLMTLQQVVVFEHSDPLGNCRAADLFRLIQVNATTSSPRSFAEYEVTIDKTRLPAGVTVTTMYPEQVAQAAAE